nr:uncharacterized protein LOC117844313 [Setaria viridis]
MTMKIVGQALASSSSATAYHHLHAQRMVMAGLPLEAHAAFVHAALHVSPKPSQELAAARAAATAAGTAPRFHDELSSSHRSTGREGPRRPAACGREGSRRPSPAVEANGLEVAPAALGVGTAARPTGRERPWRPTAGVRSARRRRSAWEGWTTAAAGGSPTALAR